MACVIAVNAVVPVWSETIRQNGKDTASSDTDYSFAYWAYDQEGTQIASVDIDFGYRVTKKTDLWDPDSQFPQTATIPLLIPTEYQKPV